MESIEDFLSVRRTKSEINNYKEEIVDYLKEKFIPPTSPKKDQFESWFEGYFKNYIYNNKINLFDQDFSNDLLHKIDYLNSAQAKKRFDRMTWDVLENQVEDWDGWLQKRAEKGDDPQGVSLVSQLSDNWSAVELKSKLSLSYEGGVMGHCVGSYYDKVNSGRARLFSLRDKKDASHITIEYNVSNGEIVQIQGKENKQPKESYHKYLFEFATNEKLMFSTSMMNNFGFKQLGYEYLPPGKIYHEKLIEYLKMGEEYVNGGVLDLRGEDCKNLFISGVWDSVKLENAINVSGVKNLTSTNISLVNCSDKIDFENVVVDNLSIKSSIMSELGNILVKENLLIESSLIKEIPNYNLNSLTYKGGYLSVLENCHALADILFVENAHSLKKIPEGTYKEISLIGTGLESLDGVNVNNLIIVDAPNVNLINFEHIESADLHNVGLKSLHNVNLMGKGKLVLSNCSKLESVSDIKGSNNRLELSNNENLRSVSGVSVAFLNLKSNKKLEVLEKIRAHSANLSDVDFNKVKTRRINLRKINTNNPDLIRTRKLSGLSRG
jgi:plasmid maintenance system killer protein